MSAEYGNIVAKERNRLEEVIPLDVPYSIAIDPSNLCNFKCVFCAIQKAGSEELSFKKQLMDFELFCKIIDDMKEFKQPLKVLRINGQGEPLLNPYFPDMVKYAKKMGVAEKIETITNGSLLNPELNQKLIDSGIDRIRISIEAINDDEYSEISGRKIELNKLLDNIRDLHDRSGACEIYCKTVDIAVPTIEDRKKFEVMMSDICDRFFIDRVIPLWSDFDEINDVMIESDSGTHGQKIKRVNICPYPFYSCIINPEGDVTLCCADWKRKLIIGNAGKESIVDIWRGSLIRQFWCDMAAGLKNKYEMCSKCSLPCFDCNDDIDSYGKLIYSNLTKSENQ